VSVKVSIIVPTYAPGDRINGLVESLDAQTMPTTDFEVIYVDDGSPDDTWKRLQRIRDARDNVRIERIENSGWPSRPRNVGLELAEGEYVLFMDHDDELYPRALEAGYEMAARTHADVLNGKETRTDQSKWAIEVYSSNMDNAIDRDDIHPLIPTNPHKLFRRALLMEHDIRFPEGRRVLWEDVFFALDVAKHAKVISVLADTPFYHWVRKGSTASSSYTKDKREFWHWVREIVVQTNDKLAGPALEQQWRLMLLHQYRSRVLAPLGPSLFAAPKDEFDFVREVVDDLLANHIPESLDTHLTPTQLGRAALVRAGRWDLLEKLVAVDAGLVGISTATSVRWVNGTVQVAAESRWKAGDKPLAIRRDGERIVRDLPDDVAAALPDAALDMDATLAAAHTSIGVRARDTGVTWMLPGDCQVRIDDVEGRPELVVTAEAVLDPATAVFGRPLDENSWDFTGRNVFLGAINQRGLRTSTGSRCALLDGHIYIAYKNMSGMLSFDIDQTNRSLSGSAKLDPKVARFTTQDVSGPRFPPGRRTVTASFELPFSGVVTDSTSTITCRVAFGKETPRPARIVARHDGAWLEGSLVQKPGTHPMTLKLDARDVDTGIDVTVSPQGGLAFARRPG
jgi:Glycosyl transferase family 2